MALTLLIFHNDLYQYLTSIDMTVARFPDATDIDAQWPKIGENYMPDAQ